MMSRKASKVHISNSGKSNHTSTNNLNIPTFDNNNNTEKSSIEWLFQSLIYYNYDNLDNIEINIFA